MPIGKNAIKRVENNGYSKVTTSAPDMENSTEFPLTPKPMKKKSTVKAPTVKKSAPKTLPEQKNTEAVKASEEKVSSATASGVIANVSEAVIEKVLSTETESSYVNFGRELPVHLL